MHKLPIQQKPITELHRAGLRACFLNFNDHCIRPTHPAVFSMALTIRAFHRRFHEYYTTDIRDDN